MATQTITAVNKGDTDMVPVLTEVALVLLIFCSSRSSHRKVTTFHSRSVKSLGSKHNSYGRRRYVGGQLREKTESEGVFMSGPTLNSRAIRMPLPVRPVTVFTFMKQSTGSTICCFLGSHDATTSLSAIEAASKDGDTLVVDRAGVREFMSGVSSWPELLVLSLVMTSVIVITKHSCCTAQ